MGAVGRIPSNSGDHGDQVYLVTVQLLQLAVIFHWTLWEAYSASPDLDKFMRQGKKLKKNSM